VPLARGLREGHLAAQHLAYVVLGVGVQHDVHIGQAKVRVYDHDAFIEHGQGYGEVDAKASFARAALTARHRSYDGTLTRTAGMPG
jgi:hypothetical protein